MTVWHLILMRQWPDYVFANCIRQYWVRGNNFWLTEFFPSSIIWLSETRSLYRSNKGHKVRMFTGNEFHSKAIAVWCNVNFYPSEHHSVQECTSTLSSLLLLRQDGKFQMTFCSIFSCNIQKWLPLPLHRCCCCCIFCHFCFDSGLCLADITSSVC